MTTVAVEDERLVEPDELSEMVTDAIRRIPVEMCDSDEWTFELVTFSTDAEARVTATGEGTIQASLCGMESAECRVEFDAVGHDPEASEGLKPTKIFVRVATERLAE